MKVNGMKKADVILGISIAAVSLALFAARFFLQKEGASVTVEINGETYGTYELDEEQVIRHYDVKGKLCPLYYVEHEDAWLQMKKDIMAEKEALIAENAGK